MVRYRLSGGHVWLAIRVFGVVISGYALDHSVRRIDMDDCEDLRHYLRGGVIARLASLPQMPNA